MTICWERLNALVPYSISFSLQVLSFISQKLARVALRLWCCAEVAPVHFPQLKNQDIGFPAITGWVPLSL